MPCPLVGCKMCITPTWVALQCKNTWEHTQQWWWVGICIKYKKCKCRTQVNAQCKSTLPGRGGLQSVPINSSSRAPSTLSSHPARCMFLSFSHQIFWRLWLCSMQLMGLFFKHSRIQRPSKLRKFEKIELIESSSNLIIVSVCQSREEKLSSPSASRSSLTAASIWWRVSPWESWLPHKSQSIPALPS